MTNETPNHERAQAARDEKHEYSRRQRADATHQARIDDRILRFEYVIMCPGVVTLVAISRSRGFEVWTRDATTGEGVVMFVTDSEEQANADYDSIVHAMKRAKR